MSRKAPCNCPSPCSPLTGVGGRACSPGWTPSSAHRLQEPLHCVGPCLPAVTGLQPRAMGVTVRLSAEQLAQFPTDPLGTSLCHAVCWARLLPPGLSPCRGSSWGVVTLPESFLAALWRAGGRGARRGSPGWGWPGRRRCLLGSGLCAQRWQRPPIRLPTLLGAPLGVPRAVGGRGELRRQGLPEAGALRPPASRPPRGAGSLGTGGRAGGGSRKPASGGDLTPGQSKRPQQSSYPGRGMPSTVHRGRVSSRLCTRTRAIRLHLPKAGTPPSLGNNGDIGD